MKNIFFILVLGFTILTSTNLFSQEKQYKHKERKKEIEAKKVAFVSDRISLTTEEAQLFWPVYNEYMEAKENLMKENRRRLKGHNFNYDDFSEKELLEMAEKEIENLSTLLELKKKYHIKFLSVLTPKKLLMFYDAERDFKKVILDDLREKRRK